MKLSPLTIASLDGEQTKMDMKHISFRISFSFLLKKRNAIFSLVIDFQSSDYFPSDFRNEALPIREKTVW